MNRIDEEHDHDLIDLGAASVETRGGGPMPWIDSQGTYDTGLSND